MPNQLALKMDDAERESNINLDQSVGVKRFFILKNDF